MYALFIYGFVITFIVTYILKQTIKAERPPKGKKKYADGGMPSGHAQSCFFSTAFVYFVLRKMNWLYVYLLLSTLICYERVIHNHQSLLQVVVGGIIGIAMAYALYMFTNEKIKGKIKEKPDDDGPI